MCVRRVLLTMAAGIAVLTAGRPGAGEAEAIRVEVTGRRWAATSLFFELVLKEPKRLDVPLDALPWGGDPDLQLVAVRTDDGSVLPRPDRLREQSESPVTRLEAGRKLQGRVPLAEAAEGLAEALRETDVIVFWSFRLRVPGRSPSNRTGGWVVVPKE